MAESESPQIRQRNVNTTNPTQGQSHHYSETDPNSQLNQDRVRNEKVDRVLGWREGNVGKANWLLGRSEEDEGFRRESERKRGLRQTEVPNTGPTSFFNTELWELVVLPLILTVVGFATRVYRLGLTNMVIWDEAHFGKFGNYYINREFYHDVHPPLGKMLVGLSGFLSGNNGTFQYKSGTTYPEDVDYTFQRFFLAQFGVALIPLAYFTALNMRLSRSAAVLVSTFVLFDNAFCVISRFILLDSMLLAFTALSFFFLTGFHKQQNRPFSLSWWVWLTGTGISLGLASSVKWVGFFVVALAGLYTIEDLYHKFGESEMPKDEYLTHWVARMVLLIVVPFLVYLTSFFIHFTILNHSGPGDATMSSLFQARLVGSSIGRGPLQVAYGSKVTIKSNALGGGLLHSHPSLYPEGSRQHQITIYHHSDSNNDWVFVRDHQKTIARRQSLKASQLKTILSDSSSEVPPAISSGSASNPEAGSDAKGSQPGEQQLETGTETNTKDETEDSDPHNTYLDPDENLDEPVQFLKDGDIVRLIHLGTNANLHSHNVKAPMTDKDYEVSGYLNRTMGDNNDYWAIEIRDDIGGASDKSLNILTTRFRLRHMTLGCYLVATGNTLPPWGFSQGEVTCQKKVGDTTHSLWNIEDHNNVRLKHLPSGVTSTKSTFLRDFVHLNVAMWNTNNALIPDEDKDDALASQPYHWPLMLKGIRMCGWEDKNLRFYMMGNPFVWWLSTFSLVALLVMTGYHLIRFQRGYREWYRSDWYAYLHNVKFIGLGYFLQYVPYYIMGRVMYVHHYFPALYFAVFAPAFLLDRACPPTARLPLLLLTCLLTLVTFLHFAPLTFGMTLPVADYRHLDWLTSWRISDRHL